MTPGITAAMIVLNGAGTLDRCLASVRDHVDQIIIGIDDRTTDDSEAIAARYNANTFRFQWRNDFSHARNLVADRVETDWIIVVDDDDYISAIDGSLIPADGYFGAYVTVKHGENILRSARIYRKEHARYVAVVHEFLKFDEPRVTTLPVTITHERGDKVIEPDRNLKYLEDIMPLVFRYILYYGRENIENGQYEEGIQALSQFIQMTTSESEKLQAVIDIAQAYYKMNRIKDSRRFCLMAIEINQDFQPAYILLGKIAYFRQEWTLCVNWMECALHVKKILYIFDFTERDYKYACDVLSVAYYSLGEPEKGKRFLEKCLEMDPGNERFLNNKKFFEEATA